MRGIIKVRMNYLYRHEQRDKMVTLNEIAKWTKEGKYKRRVEIVRGTDMMPLKGRMAYRPLAIDDLPTVMPACGLTTDNPTSALKKHGEDYAYTGLVLLSFRITDGVDTLERLRHVVNLWEQTLMSFAGTSGRSLKVLTAYRLTGGGLPTDPAQTALFQQYAYKRAADFAFASTGIKPEEVEHNGSESFRMSYDPAVYYQPEARPVEMEQPTEPLTEMSVLPIETKEATLDTKILPGYTRREMEATMYNFIYRKLAYGEKLDKEVYLAIIATECRNSGIDKELATSLTLANGEFFGKEVLVRSAFNAAYEKHPLGMQNPVETTLMHQQLLEEFLRRRYMFRKNCVTGDIEYQEKHRYMLQWKPLTEEAQNGINNAAIREGIKAWPKDFERYINNDHTERYDPVRQWLDDLPQWDGRDRLGEMADRVPTSVPDWRDNFKIWMRSMVSQWRSGRDAMYGAQMVLMLVGGQGTRKSTFMRMLLPKELMPFYIDRIDFTNKKEALRALSRFLLINIDEYDQVSKAQTAYLKHLIQRTDVKERKLYSTTFEQSQRYAAFCATTNSLMPLKDESGSRRYMVVEVDGTIDTDTQGDKTIDYRQLYAQIVYEIENGEEYAFKGEREQLIISRNADYYELPNVVSLFNDHFRKPEKGDIVFTVSPTEILSLIKSDLKANVVNQSNATLIGSYLHRNGFQKGKGDKRRCYLIARKS